MRIGFFDSGIGGISVLSDAITRLPDEEYIFCADKENAPYGVKSTEEIARFAEENARFLLSKGADAIVVACNTATAAAIKRLREISPVPVIGMEPAVKPAVEMFDAGDKAAGERGRVLVTATPLTLREAKLKDLIERVDVFHRVDLLALPGLVPIAESGGFDSEEAEIYLREALKSTDPSHYAALVMGCTHFIFFAPFFQRIMGGEVRLIDGNAGTVKRLADIMGLEFADGVKRTRFEEAIRRVRWYISGREVTDGAALSKLHDICERARDIRGVSGPPHLRANF